METYLKYNLCYICYELFPLVLSRIFLNFTRNCRE